MTPETLDLFRGIVNADAPAVQRALAAGADVNATDSKGRNVASHAALGDAIDAIDAPIQPRLSERRLEVLQIILEHPELSLYSLNAPLPWAGGVTLLGLMSWLNMPTEIMFLLEFTQGLVEVNAMDEQGATPLMYAARDGSLEVVQRLIAHGARPDLRDKNQRSTIQYALPHPQILWLCEDAVRRERAGEYQPSGYAGSSSSSSGARSSTSLTSGQSNDFFFSTSKDALLTPPSLSHFNSAEIRRTFDALSHATRAGDVAALRALLFPAQSENLRTPSLVNLRDGSGLSLVHHAVSQRRHLDSTSAVLEVLYRAGADIGLFSTLGFSPLHHLARTARDPAEVSKSTQGKPADPPVLYTYTIRLLRDLRAPLGATDPKGETPLHAAAEHGHSRLVLQAMLDFDGAYFTRQSVRESRNERGLRPVEVCRPEFLSLFEAQQPSKTDLRLRSQDSWDSSLMQIHSPPACSTNTSPSSKGRPYSAGRPSSVSRPLSSGRGLLSKASDGSLQSRSSASSASSGARSHHSHPPQYSPQSRKPGTPLHTHALPTPSPTGPSLSDVSDASSSIDVPAYTRDLMSNLSLCASALHAYSQGQQSTQEMDRGDLPDLPALSEALLFTRDVGSLVIEHWTVRLDLARVEFERAREELEKAQALRERVAREVDAKSEGAVRIRRHTRQGASTSSVSQRHATVQTEASAVYIAHLETVARLEQETASRAKQLSSYARMEDEQLKEPARPERAAAMLRLMQERRDEERKLRDAEDEVRVNRWYAESASKGEEIGTPLLLGWVKRGTLPPLEIVMQIEDSDASQVGREVRMPVSSATDEPSKGASIESRPTSSLANALRSAPRILQRVGKDLNGVVSQLAQVTQSFIRAQQSVAEASALVEQALQAREDRIQALTRIQHELDHPPPPSSFRLPRVSLRSPDPTSSVQVSPAEFTHQLSPSASSSSLYRRYVGSGSQMEDPHILRQLLTRKIQKYMERVFNELQMAYVWLRIVREVLRGLRRRAS